MLVCLTDLSGHVIYFTSIGMFDLCGRVFFVTSDGMFDLCGRVIFATSLVHLTCVSTYFLFSSFGVFD